MMAAIRGKDTKPEMVVRRFLHRAGFRFRLHVKDLPGKPDIVLPRYRTVILVHGCYWHRHPGCHFATTPKTNSAFWLDKFEKNVERDRRNVEQLEKAGWRVIIAWECEVKSPERLEALVAEIIGRDRSE